MATLAAHDQENAIRNISIGPGGKPLNAGVKGLGAKTPGNKAPKTPFKVPLNDENVIKQAGKSVLKNTGKGNENAFLTPAGPRTRAPLGMKTTNANSKAFQTPAPLGSSAKTQKISPRLRRPKVKVHQPEAAAESEDDVPEVEYMPPKEVPLLDDMDDYLPKDWNFPKIDGQNMARGIWEAYHNPIEDDGRPKKLREFEEQLEREKKQRDVDFDKVFSAQMAKDEAEVRRYMGIEDPKDDVPKPKRTTSNISTMRARSAAQALSPAAPKRTFAAPTAAVRSRLPSGFVSSKKTTRPLVEPTPARRAAAVAASNSTIGYAQGRAGRAAPAARKPLSNVTKPAPFSTTTTRRPASTVRSRSAFSRSSSTATDATLVPADEEAYRTAADVERELELLLLARDEEEEEQEDSAWVNSFHAQLQVDAVDEELEDFQLTLPEGF
ncbi:hypothetical protein BDU57DRAFT_453586 [Ampelomyces quisqualis]|uniref:Uncharacterized protein n=1 Tax=Ampelomyces quisqualis TaxID=50730 RepID=A0A6A5QLH7_AMPQU|nr:hypothetical protein BDU57DRAFT_453586 [Ampelomyces quisqualis]